MWPTCLLGVLPKGPANWGNAPLGRGRGRIGPAVVDRIDAGGVGGCAVGICLAMLFLRLLPKLDPGNYSGANEASLDARVILVAIGGSLLTSLLAGLMLQSHFTLELTEFLKSHAMHEAPLGTGRCRTR